MIISLFKARINCHFSCLLKDIFKINAKRLDNTLYIYPLRDDLKTTFDPNCLKWQVKKILLMLRHFLFYQRKTLILLIPMNQFNLLLVLNYIFNI